MQKIKCYDYAGNYVNCLAQWDKNQVVYIDNLENGILPGVHYSSTHDKDVSWEFENVVSLDSDDRIKIRIPDRMMQYDGKLYIFLFYGEDESTSITKYVVELTVHSKPKPDDWIYVDEEWYKTMKQIELDLAEAMTYIDDKVNNPLIGEVGQILEIESVDQDGRPKTYKAVDKPHWDDVILEETDPTVPAWAKEPSKPTYTASEIGADESGTAETKVSEHNTSDGSHNDIRLLITELRNIVTSLLDSDDETLNQTSEIVAYIKSNKSLIDAITTEKISVADIMDNLTTNVSNKPLSAKQGVELKKLIDAIIVPTLLSQLGEDETHRTVTDAEKQTWSNKSDFSGSYNDLTDKPTIPTKTSQLTNDSNFAKTSDIPSVPVQSVNGKTGDVQLNASDVSARPSTWMPSASEVGALPSTTKIPSNTSDLTNNSGFITKAVNDLTNYYLKSESYTRTEIDNKLSAIPKFAIQVVSSLPTTNISTTTVYLLKSGEESQNLYTEYIYVNSAWECLGEQSVDLTGYALKKDIPTKISQLSDDKNYDNRINSNNEKITEFENSFGWIPGSKDTGPEYLLDNVEFNNSTMNYKITTEIAEKFANADNITISCNGDEFTCTNGASGGSFNYGNQSLLSGQNDTGEPFLLTGSKSSTNLVVLISEPCTISAYIISEKINKMPEEYIPDIVLTEEDKTELQQAVNNISEDVELHKKDTTVHITVAERDTWNAKSNFSGAYADLSGKPTIPSKTSQLTNDSNFLTSVPSEYVTETELNNKKYATQTDVTRISEQMKLNSKISYGTCDTAATTAEKVVTISNTDDWELSVGTVVMVLFSITNKASNVTLNINGTGAYPIWYNNEEYTSTNTTYTGYAKRVTTYMFNGTHWVWIANSYDANSTYKNVTLGHGYVTCDTAEATTAKVGTLASYTLTVGGITAVKFTYAVPANSTLNINNKGAKNIFYRGAKIVANVIKAGDIATFIYDGTQYQLLTIDRWQNDIKTLSEQKADKATTLSGYGITDGATKTELNQLSEQKADKTAIPTKTSQLQNDSNFVTENEFGSLEDKVESDVYKESIAQKVPYVKVAEHPICVNSIAEMTDTSKMYVLNSDGMYYAYMRKEVTTEGETVPNFTNLMDDPNAYAKKGYRYSHSGGAFKDQASDCAIVVPIPKTTSLVLRTRGGNYVNCAYPTTAYLGTSNTVFPTTTAATPTNGTSSNGDTYLNLTLPSSADYKYVVFHISSNVDLDTLIVTANEEITYTTTEGGTTIVEEWVNTGISYNQPANYESRVIANEQNIADLKNKTASLEKRVDSIGTGSSINSSGTTVFSTPAYAPVPQLPADGSEGSDFNIKSVTTQNAYDYMDALANKYTGYITKQTMGKDASGSFDNNRYILTKAYYRAWQRENYPKMFAWKNGNTVIYSVSVSPRVGDNMYSTPYVGTVYKAVTSVNCTAGTLSTRTVNGLVFTRYIDGDIEPTIVYTNVPMTPPGYFKTAPVYDSAYNQTTNVSSVGDGYFVGKNGITYKRYPFEDRKADKTKPLSIFILANEHGLHGDALIPSFVAMRMAKDLCKNTENPFLKWLKENCMITMIPVGNPWGYGRYLVNNSSGYYNSNGININRNYDTPGWATSDTNYGDVETFGEYAGSEIETQHIMNTMQLCKPAVGISMHGLGYPTEYRGLTDNGYFIYQGQGFSTSRMYKVAETLYTAYGLSRGPDTDYAEHYENCGKSPAYIQYVGAVGGLTETICWEAGTENEYTPIAMEQAYTQLLLFLQTWCEEAIEKMS